MSDATSNGHGENAEIRNLLAELELQIESVNAGLARIRGTVARISYAALGSSSPTTPSWEEVHLELPAQAAVWLAAEVEQASEPAAPAEPELLPEALVSPQPPPIFTPDSPEHGRPPEPGFWTSVAEGASWPRAQAADDPPPVPEAVETIETPAGAGTQPSPDAEVGADGVVESEIEPGDVSAAWDAAAPEAAPIADGAVDQEAVLQPEEPSLQVEDPAPASLEASPEEPSAAPVALNELGWPIESPPAEPEQTPAQPPAESPARDWAEDIPKPRITGWTDESIWSQDFQWPAPKRESHNPESEVARGEPAPVTNDVSDIVAQIRAKLEASGGEEELDQDTLEEGTWQPEAWESREEAASTAKDVSDIVAQVRAELEASGQEGEQEQDTPAEAAWQPESWETGEAAQATTDVRDIVAQVRAELEASARDGVQEQPVFDDGFSDTGVDSAVEGQDDVAKREEVSRAVEEIRRQIERGDIDAVMQDEQIETALPGIDEEPQSGAAGDDPIGVGPSTGADGGERPAFRLAAPGSIPDWSHVKMEPSGPPVVVMKDTDGRVELASVYETLNELGCGDGAALLNYTPHSVTVGLPLMAQFPTPDQMAGAVEKVFGLTSRVESDGVRITVNIGADPKQRSAGAA